MTVHDDMAESALYDFEKRANAQKHTTMGVREAIGTLDIYFNEGRNAEGAAYNAQKLADARNGVVYLGKVDTPLLRRQCAALARHTDKLQDNDACLLAGALNLLEHIYDQLEPVNKFKPRAERINHENS